MVLADSLEVQQPVNIMVSPGQDGGGAVSHVELTDKMEMKRDGVGSKMQLQCDPGAMTRGGSGSEGEDVDQARRWDKFLCQACDMDDGVKILKAMELLEDDSGSVKKGEGGCLGLDGSAQNEGGRLLLMIGGMTMSGQMQEVC
jgi:hypothetical protein